MHDHVEECVLKGIWLDVGFAGMIGKKSAWPKKRGNFHLARGKFPGPSHVASAVPPLSFPLELALLLSPESSASSMMSSSRWPTCHGEGMGGRCRSLNVKRTPPHHSRPDIPSNQVPRGEWKDEAMCRSSTSMT